MNYFILISVIVEKYLYFNCMNLEENEIEKCIGRHIGSAEGWRRPHTRSDLQ
jgi:hypothetical protein